MRAIFVASVVVLLMSVSVGVCEIAKSLGDINGDGVVESVNIRVITGASSDGSDVTVYSGKRKVLTLPRLLGNVLTGKGGETADGFAILPDGQIALWKGDWLNTSSKWEPHYYDFWWYRWDPRSRKYIQALEGFTVKSYSAESARRSMKDLAAKPGRRVALSEGRSFGQDAVALGAAHFRRVFKTATQVRIPGSPDEARTYTLDMSGTYVTFLRSNGKVQFGKMEG